MHTHMHIHCHSMWTTSKKEVKTFPRSELYSLVDKKVKQTISKPTLRSVSTTHVPSFDDPTRPEFLMLLYLDAQVVRVGVGGGDKCE